MSIMIGNTLVTWDELPRPEIRVMCKRCAKAGALWGWSADAMIVSPRGVGHWPHNYIAAGSTHCGHDATGDKWWWPL